ncbi:unnamed protein product, partial [Mesorhabditis spiculigera]
MEADVGRSSNPTSTKQKLRKFLDAKDKVLTGDVPIRAVNLAGWLVAEYAITKGSLAWEGVPEDTAIQGEYITMKYLGCEKGDAQFKEHRVRFITEADFCEIAGYGFNTVRIPIGYWLRGADGFSGDELDVVKTWAPGSVDYLDRAIREWAYKNNLFVMIAIQAAMGSQNGKAASSPQKLGHNGWCEKPTNVQNTHAFAEWLAQRYREDAAFLGISLLDEPENVETQPLKQYYYDCNGRIRDNAESDCLLSISPLVDQQCWYNIRHEWHVDYAVNPKMQSFGQVLDHVRTSASKLITNWEGRDLFIGKWSLDCGFQMTDEEMREFAMAQLEAYKSARGGWCFSAWKFYNDDAQPRNQRSARQLLKNGILSSIEGVGL